MPIGKDRFYIFGDGDNELLSIRNEKLWIYNNSNKYIISLSLLESIYYPSLLLESNTIQYIEKCDQTVFSK